MEAHAWINSLAALLGFIATTYFAVRTNIGKHERELAEIRIKVDTMWNFLLRRAAVEGVTTGMLGLNSPLEITEPSIDLFSTFAKDLREFYKTKGEGLDEKSLALLIEQHFGTRLVKEICVPNKISLGVCLLIATAIAKDSGSLLEILEEPSNV